MPLTILDQGSRNEVSIPAAVLNGQEGVIVLEGDDNRVALGEGTTVRGARIRLGNSCTFECGPDCRLGTIDVEADHDSHVRIGAGTEFAAFEPPAAQSAPQGPSVQAAATPAAVEPLTAPPTEPHAFSIPVHSADPALRHHMEYFVDGGVAESAYLRQGAWSVDAVRQVAAAWFGGLSHVPRMLEYCPAFGCVTRHLVHEISPERLWCFDTDPESVEFVQSNFGTRGVVVPASPAAIKSADAFDLIFAPSVFSQVSAERFEPLLERLLGMLAPGGVLAFGAFGEHWYAPRQLPADGIAFVPGADSGRSGVTFVSEHFVRCCIERISGLDWPYRRLPRGLCSHLDLFVVGANEESGPLADRIRRGPEGCLEWCRGTANGIEVSGWAGDPDPGHAVPIVEIRIDGDVVARSRPSLQRPDVAAVLGQPTYAAAGWATRVGGTGQAAGAAGGRLDVRVVADDGRERSLANAPLAALLGRRLC